MAITVSAAITDRGRAAFADMTVRGTSFIVRFFDVGNGGHDVGNPIVALTPDTSLADLPGKTFDGGYDGCPLLLDDADPGRR